MNTSVLTFTSEQLDENLIRGRSILEAGSRAVAGPDSSVRPILEGRGPAQYVGVDIVPGLYVDEVCDAGALQERFGNDSFDIVVSTEMLEHAREWRQVISNLKRVVRPGGTILVTTRSYGFPYHAWPHDYWRYEIDDMREIFTDFAVEIVQHDPEVPGVFLRATKPQNFNERDLDDIELFSMVKQRRTLSITKRDEQVFALAYTPIRLVRTIVPQSLKDRFKATRLSKEWRVRSRTTRHG